MAKHKFKTEVGELLKLMTHSLYSNKEIFYRELISNSSDAIDKFNYLKLTDDKFKDISWEPSIDITLEDDKNHITIMDNGIGMNEDDLMNHLGTIAKSGTQSFIDKLTGDKKKDSNLIGQFGVGFYSVFMIAKKVEVITKKAGESQAYKFIADGSGEFDISPTIKEKHGTLIYIYLKEDANEFSSKWRAEEIIKKYSNHIPYKIMLNYVEEVTIPEDDKKTEDNEKANDDKKEPKKEKVNKRNQANAATALWTVPKSELKKDDYLEFYKTISHSDDEPLTYLHNKVEGSQEFTTLFYIPKTAPMDLYRADYKSNIKLYVKRVFISDDDKELLPVYLRFIKGIIDSEDLPLNVSREILQDNKILSNIKQSGTKKILQAIKKLKGDNLDSFTESYNKVLKEGVIQDYANKELLLEIVRYKSSIEKEMVFLDEYISRGNSEKKEIYYIIGENETILRNSPLLEAYKKSNIEVLILDDKEIDEFVTPSIGTFKEWSFKDITSIDAPDNKTDEEKKEINEKFKSLTEKITKVLGDSVAKVKTTTRLTSSPSCIVKDSSDPMAGMSHMFAQMGQKAPEVKFVLEINPDHELIKKLDKLDDNNQFDDLAWILLDSAKISDGIDPKDKTAFASRITKISTALLK